MSATQPPNPVFVTITDNRGRTLTQFIGHPAANGEYIWYGGSKPDSPQARRRQSKLSPDELALDAKHWQAHSNNPLKEIDGGRQVLLLPGLSLRWEKAQQALTSLVVAAVFPTGVTTMVVGDTLVVGVHDLRACISS